MRLIQVGVGGFGASWLWAVRECESFQHLALVDANPAMLDSVTEVVGAPPNKRFTGLETAIANVEAANTGTTVEVDRHPDAF